MRFFGQETPINPNVEELHPDSNKTVSSCNTENHKVFAIYLYKANDCADLSTCAVADAIIERWIKMSVDERRDFIQSGRSLGHVYYPYDDRMSRVLQHLQSALKNDYTLDTANLTSRGI